MSSRLCNPDDGNENGNVRIARNCLHVAVHMKLTSGHILVKNLFDAMFVDDASETEATLDNTC